jgi:hypothetical protein
VIRNADFQENRTSWVALGTRKRVQVTFITVNTRASKKVDKSSSKAKLKSLPAGNRRL